MRKRKLLEKKISEMKKERKKERNIYIACYIRAGVKKHYSSNT